MAASSILLLPTLFLFLVPGNAHNITEILATESGLSQFNSYLTQTRLADEINSRQMITILVLNDAAMSSLAENHPLPVVKNILSLHIILDYYDSTKLHNIPNGTVLSTSLYQTTGKATGNVGFVNITDQKGGIVGFGSGESGSKLDSRYTKSVKEIPYDISVVEISAPIIAPALLTAPAVSGVNITALLETAGCKAFSALISSTGVLKLYQAQMEKGLTIFAPNDEAFKAKGSPDLSKLSNGEIVSLLKFHALSTYAPVGTLKTTKEYLPTMASPVAGKFSLTAITAGDSVTLYTGVDSSRIASTVIDSTPVAILTVDDVLLPMELFGTSPAPAPALAPKAASPPAPPMEPPAGSPEPACSPEAADDSSKKADAAKRSATDVMGVIVSVAFCVILLVI